MSSPIVAEQRQVPMKLSNGPTGQVLTATVPFDVTEQDISKVGVSAVQLIKRLTGCNCLSGRISYVVEHNYADAIRVNLDGKVGP